MRAERPHLLPRALPPPRVLWTLSHSQTLRAPTARSPCLSPRPRSRPPLMAEQSSSPQPFSPLLAFSLPTSTTLSFAAISFTPCSCSCSPSQPATLAVEAPATAAVAGARAWPSRRGPPWAKPSSPAGAQGPPGAPPSLSRRRPSLLRPEQRDPGDLPVQIYVEDLTRQFDESQGPSCNVIDSSE